MMQKSDFFFELPQGLIAQEPCEPREDVYKRQARKRPVGRDGCAR